MIRSRKQLDELTNTREIGSILVIEEVEAEKALAGHISDITVGTSKLVEFDEVVVQPDHPNQKIQIRREIPRI